MTMNMSGRKRFLDVMYSALTFANYTSISSLMMVLSGLLCKSMIGSLHDLIDDNKSSGCRRPFRDQVALDIIIQIVLNMAYLHKKNSILHKY